MRYFYSTVRSIIFSFGYSFVRLAVLSFVYFIVSSFVHSYARSLDGMSVLPSAIQCFRPSIRPLLRSFFGLLPLFICWFFVSFICSFGRSFICLIARLSVHLSVCLRFLPFFRQCLNQPVRTIGGPLDPSSARPHMRPFVRRIVRSFVQSVGSRPVGQVSRLVNHSDSRIVGLSVSRLFLAVKIITPKYNILHN